MGLERVCSFGQGHWRSIHWRKFGKTDLRKTEFTFHRTRYLHTYPKTALYLLKTNVEKGNNSASVSPRSQGSRVSGGTLSDSKGGREDNTKRRRISTSKQEGESSTSGEEVLSAFPCLVTLNPGVRIVSVAAGGRHTLALSGIMFIVL